MIQDGLAQREHGEKIKQICPLFPTKSKSGGKPLRLSAFQVALEEGRGDLKGFWAVVDVLSWVCMQALIVGAQTVEQIQLPLALKTLIVPLHHE